MDTFVVTGERAGLELDEYLCLQYPGLPKGFVRREISAGHVLVDGVECAPNKRLRTNQVVMATIDWENAPDRPVDPGVDIPVLHEDDQVLVVDKPAGLAVEPERWLKGLGSLAGALLQMVEERAAGADAEELPFRPRLVHRIDKDTTGAVLVAKSLEAERALRTAFEAGTVGKRYLALVEGDLGLGPDGSMTLDDPIGPARSGRMRIAADGKPSRTDVEVAESFDGYTLARCSPRTGRTHQIRVHMAHAGFPLVVDPLYGRRDALRLSEFKSGYRAKRGMPEKPLIDRLTLHAHEVDVPPLPGSDRDAALTVTAPVPRDFERVLKQMRKVRPPRTRRFG
ncbi:MAG: RluA family pseudouridine synthase [Planctomycetota bacterium]